MPIRGMLLSAAFGLLGWLIANQTLLILVALFVIFFTLITYKAAARAAAGAGPHYRPAAVRPHAHCVYGGTAGVRVAV